MTDPECAGVRESILGSLKSEVVYFSSYQKCTLVTNQDTTEVPELSTKQEEADTNVILLAQHVLRNNESGAVIIRSHSGDVDIAVLALSHFIDDGTRVVLCRYQHRQISQSLPNERH